MNDDSQGYSKRKIFFKGIFRAGFPFSGWLKESDRRQQIAGDEGTIISPEC